MHALLLAAALCAPAVAYADDQRSAPEKKEQAEKKGALKERVDPQKDAKLQKANIKRLERNAEISRASGNRVGAWAAESDAKHAKKLLDKDEKLLENGEQKQKVDDQEVKK
jgi:tRNA A37 N6-isopentenylltransferase MiaA